MPANKHLPASASQCSGEILWGDPEPFLHKVGRLCVLSLAMAKLYSYPAHGPHLGTVSVSYLHECVLWREALSSVEWAGQLLQGCSPPPQPCSLFLASLTIFVRQHLHRTIFSLKENSCLKVSRIENWGIYCLACNCSCFLWGADLSAVQLASYLTRNAEKTCSRMYGW